MPTPTSRVTRWLRGKVTSVLLFDEWYLRSDFEIDEQIQAMLDLKETSYDFGREDGEKLVLVEPTKRLKLRVDRERLVQQAAGSFDIATERPYYNSAIASEWRQKAGFAGETNFRIDFAFAKKFWITELLVNAGYKFVGSPDRGVRVQYIDSSKVGTDDFLVGDAVESGIDLHDFLIFNGGLSLPAFTVWDHQVWLWPSSARRATSAVARRSSASCIRSRCGSAYNSIFPGIRTSRSAWGGSSCSTMPATVISARADC